LPFFRSRSEQVLEPVDCVDAVAGALELTLGGEHPAVADLLDVCGVEHRVTTTRHFSHLEGEDLGSSGIDAVAAADMRLFDLREVGSRIDADADVDAVNRRIQLRRVDLDEFVVSVSFPGSVVFRELDTAGGLFPVEHEVHEFAAGGERDAKVEIPRDAGFGVPSAAEIEALGSILGLNGGRSEVDFFSFCKDNDFAHSDVGCSQSYIRSACSLSHANSLSIKWKRNVTGRTCLDLKRSRNAAILTDY